MEQAALAPNNVSLLRPDQIEEMEGEKEALTAKMHNPVVQDKGAVKEQLRRLARQLDTQRPRPFMPSEIDAAVRREAELRASIAEGMLSQEEMRKCPPGAVDRHRRWEKAKKPLILEWQNLQRRLNAEGEDRESASIENFRPTASTMNMHNALIPGKQYHLPPVGAGLPVTFTADQIEALRALSPEIADKLGTLSNEQRQEVKEIVAQAPADTKSATGKRTMSPEHKAKMMKGAADARAAKKAGK